MSVGIIRTEATYSSDHDGRISEIVELVHARDDDRPEEAEHPCPEGVDGHGRVVKVGDGGAHLWIGRIILCSRGEVDSACQVPRIETHGGRDVPSQVISVS